MRPASRLWLRNCSPSVARDLLGRQLLDRERQRAELEDRDELVGLLRGKATDAAGADLHLAVGDRVLDDRRRDHRAVERDREVLAGVLRRELGELLGTGLGAAAFEHEVDRKPAALRIGADRGGLDLVAAEQRRVLLEVEDLALGHLRRPEGDEVEDVRSGPPAAGWTPSR